MTIVPPSYIEIPLRDSRRNVVAVAKVDIVDAHLSELRWYRTHIDREGRGGYAARTQRNSGGGDGTQRVFYLHRVVLDAPTGSEVDHINGDRLDCRRSNLRLGSRQLNAQNVPGKRGKTSRHRGVYWQKKAKRWVAQGRVDGRSKFIGQFTTEEAAVEAVRAWRQEHWPFANEERSAAPLVAFMGCAWCGARRSCRQMTDTGWWVCGDCWETAEGIRVAA